jgi:hypothetical protein
MEARSMAEIQHDFELNTQLLKIDLWFHKAITSALIANFEKSRKSKCF